MGKLFVSLGGGGGVGSDELTATLANVLKGKTVVARDTGDEIGTGTMPNNGAVSPSALGAGGSYTIPAGYHNGSGKVTVQTLATMTASGDATAAQILNGKKAYVDGNLVTGNMADKGAQTASYTPSTAVQTYTIPVGYHNGSGKVTINPIPSKYVDFSAGITFFEEGASESAMFTALGTCNQKPQAGIPVSEWKTTWSYKYDAVVWNNALGVRFVYELDENDQVDTFTGFCTKKSMDFTGINYIEVDFSSYFTAYTCRVWFYNINTYTLTYKTIKFGTDDGKKLDISGIKGQCLWGMDAYDTGGYATLQSIKFYA